MKTFRSTLLYALILSIISCTTNQSNKQSIAEPVQEKAAGIGMELPDFRLVSTQGDTIDSNSLAGKLTVIHIATTWCPYCNAEAPNLEKLYSDYKNKGVQVLIIDVKEDLALVQDKLQYRFDLSFPVLIDTDGEVAAKFAPSEVLPDLPRDEIMIASNIIIGKTGKVEFMSLLDTKNFDAKLQQLSAKLDELL